MPSLPTEVITTTNPPEVQKLQDLAKDKICLELGTFCGHTAIAMAMVAKRVFTVDTHKSDLTMGKTSSGLSLFLSGINKYDVWGKIVILVGKTEDIIPGLDFMRFDLVFIDAAHDYDSVKKDIEMTYPLLNRGGLMVFHDYDPNHEYTPNEFGVNKAVDELIEAKEMKREDLVMSLLVLRK